MKNTQTVILIIFIFQSSFCQIQFEEDIIIDNSLFIDRPNSVFIADIDGDGDNDLFSGSFLEEGLVWFENADSLGNKFVRHIISAELGSIKSLAAGDFDGDGDIDLVVKSSSRYNGMIWYENTDGNGSFIEKQQILFGDIDFGFIMTRDIDADGDLDLIVSSSSFERISYHLNTDGLGTFSGFKEVDSQAYDVPNFDMADIDGDGYLDIVSSYSISGGIDGVTWYKNRKTTNNLFSSSNLISNNVDLVSSVKAGDLDGDGDMDILTSSSGDNKIAWYKNTDGFGTFGEQQILSINVANASFVRIVDVDGDNDLDVISGSNTDNKIVWFENIDGLGNFSNERIIVTNIGILNDIQISDMDGDGDIDFVTVTDQDENIKLFKNIDGSGNFSSYTITKNIDNGKTIFAADLDGDGDKDVLSASGQKIAWYENKDGNGDYSDSQKIISEVIYGASSVWAEDLDGDGDNDVLVTASLGNYIIWFENIDGMANFGEPQTIDPYLYSAKYVYTADIDNDGDMDVISVGSFLINWYENMDGLGNFGEPQRIDIISNTTLNSIDFADLDGDSDLDILLAYNSGLSFYLNDSNGNFSSEQELLSRNNQSAKIADIDGDGDNDIVFVADEYFQSSAYVGWLENLDGLATFSESKTISTTISDPNDISILDVDNDGDLDVVTSQEGDDGKIVWHENSNGLGDFESIPQIITTSLSNPIYLFPSDVNNDSYLDIIVLSKWDYTIITLKNTAIVDTTLSINDNDFEKNNFSIYPNPASNDITINGTHIFESIFIRDFNGILLNDIELQASKSNYKLDITNLPKGLYFLEIKLGSLQIVEKFIKN